MTEYDEVRSHSFLGYIIPAAFATSLTATGSRLRNPGQLSCGRVAHQTPIGVSEMAKDPVVLWMNAPGQVANPTTGGAVHTKWGNVLCRPE